MGRKPRTTSANKPAEPSAITVESVTRQIAGHEGRTLREHFAGLCMQGLLAAGFRNTATDLATKAVQCADALIDALSSSGGAE